MYLLLFTWTFQDLFNPFLFKTFLFVWLVSRAVGFLILIFFIDLLLIDLPIYFFCLLLFIPFPSWQKQSPVHSKRHHSRWT